MECENYRLGISARLDGEETGIDDASLAWHLAHCEACRAFESEAIGLTRAVRVVATEAAPDLTPTIMAAINQQRVGRASRFDPQALRIGLITLAVVQMLLAAPMLIFGRDTGAPIHLAREIGSFDFALAVGFFFVGWRPARAYGMLPLVAAVVFCLSVTTAVDLVRGTATLLNESAHLLDVMGLAAVWEMARSAPYPGSSGTRLATTGS
ncbi:MAG TPA: zf-HC2 domain-containing protein [Acidimicrobiia bacterium]|nr:zf-HC2 domain-containing protein [Acidimicrobiia bacterium]